MTSNLINDFSADDVPKQEVKSILKMNCNPNSNPLNFSIPTNAAITVIRSNVILIHFDNGLILHDSSSKNLFKLPSILYHFNLFYIWFSVQKRED